MTEVWIVDLLKKYSSGRTDLDVITSKKEIKNYLNYLARESANKDRPIYLPGFLKESDYPQWGFKSVIPEEK